MMKKLLFLFHLFLIFSTFAGAQTYVSGNVNTTWTSSGNPYYVTGELTVLSGDVLIIQPGVRVLFQGDFSLTVEGLLQVNGTEGDSVLFSIDAGQTNEFDGIRFPDAADDNSYIRYAIVEYGDAEGTGDERYGGGILCNAASPTISFCHIRDNSAITIGGGIALYNSDATVEHCKISGNSATYAAGLYVRGNATIRGNKIYENSASTLGGGLNILQSYSPVVQNNVIFNNDCSGGDGGGVACLQSNTGDIVNNVIYNNTSAGNGGGIFVDNSGTNIECYNNILWSNSASGSGDEIYVNDGTLNADYCNVDGGAGSTGTGTTGILNYGSNNLSSNPQFLDITNADFHLTESSPCIDSGTSTGAPAVDADSNATNQDGDNNAVNGYDIGAFEFLQEADDFNSGNTSSDYFVDTFESGVSNQIASVSLSGYASGSGTITINCFTKSWPLHRPEGSWPVQRWYRISEGGDISYASANLRLFYSDTENSNELTTENIRLWRYNGSSWVYMEGTVSTGDDWVQLNGLAPADLSGDWAFSDPNDHALPVDIRSFSAETTGDGVQLNWETRSERNNIGFEIRKAVGELATFEKLSDYTEHESLRGLGTSSHGQKYAYIDTNVIAGNSYQYYLVSIGSGGERTEYPALIYSHVNSDPAGQIPQQFELSANYPNPFNSSTRFRLQIPAAGVLKLSVYDVLGRQMETGSKEVNVGQTVLRWDAGNHVSGIYYYVVRYLPEHPNKKVGNVLKSGKMLLVK